MGVGLGHPGDGWCGISGMFGGVSEAEAMTLFFVKFRKN